MDTPRTADRSTTGRDSSGTSALGDLLLSLVIVLAVTLPTWWLLGLPASHALLPVGGHLGLTAAALQGMRRAAVPRAFGPADRITLLRASMALPLLGLVPSGGELEPGVLWWAVVLASAALLLDAVDGKVARKTRTESDFGARLDMEVDAALLLLLSVLVWLTGKVGPWVILIGGMRYGFVAAGWVWPIFQRDLPPKVRRQTVCVVQGVALVACLAPVIPAGLATTIAGAALLLLTYSFAVDVRWLLRKSASPS